MTGRLECCRTPRTDGETGVSAGTFADVFGCP